MSLSSWRRNKLKEYKIYSLYYFSHINNIDLILSRGIFSKNRVEELNLDYYSFAESAVQDRRHSRNVRITDGKLCKVHDLVPVYLTPRTPTLFARRNIVNDLFFCIIQSFILCDQEFAFTDGNAAANNTVFYSDLEKLNMLHWQCIFSKTSGLEFHGGKRKRMAEGLIYEAVNINKIKKIFCYNGRLAETCEHLIKGSGLDVEIDVNSQMYY